MTNYLSLSLYIYIYIYIYIYTNIISNSSHRTRKKEKNPPGTRDKSISNHRPGEKKKILLVKQKKNVIGQKERKGQPRQTP